MPTDKIRRNPDQPRKHFDQEKLNQLAASMKEVGQIQAIIVRYCPSTRDYVLIAGERRWRAAHIAEITELHAVVTHDGDDAFARSVAENCGRADMTPMEEGRGFDEMLRLGYPIERVAAIVGKSLPYVQSRMALLKLDPAVQEAVDKGHVNVGLAVEMTRLPAPRPGRDPRPLAAR
ncbi:ParB/RepB/Spo0J family partition protein [Nonomuraea salmonea]|uniref:ParB/RepB/Spo0J family partition protein n=1 Tax=Nonomuraea salmonea TaxID=46181 RepID=UPI0031F0E51D